ncbi:hypothetical protein IRM63_03680 [Leuconostoc citreum]|uniref:hypothetical protein n=1 Tax=Leuconostoc citreum TaxID=33964 RepID=UPI001887F99D|nr:hypothetical protein [Leuconostoc citreum]QOY98370.1 hypothetical protein IRM63_03680 [Leuconostoc citreum]
MTETLVHATTLDQWKSVLDVWFAQGYEWHGTGKSYHERYFDDGWRFLLLNKDNDILKPTLRRQSIEYSEFMAQQKEDNKMETYYVTQEQLDLIKGLKNRKYPLNILFIELDRYKNIQIGLNTHEEKALLRYLGGDTSIEFEVKEQLYRLWRIDDGDRVYMKFTKYGTPDWTMDEDNAFTAPCEEIEKHKTVSWEIEKAD